jgi:hypothetical protein
VLLAACSGAPAPNPHSAHNAPTTAMPAPSGQAQRQHAIDELGRRAFRLLATGHPERLLFDDLDLRELLDGAGATRLSARRATLEERLGPTADFPAMLESARYAGICLQGAREESAGGVLGLRREGWTFERALVIGRNPDGRRIAAWIEGPFLFTNAGFGALDLERVEEPRWEHSDLEIAPCDLAIRNDLPEGAQL